MVNIKYDNNFYVNKTSYIDIQTAKKNIELFNENMHKKLTQQLNIAKENNFPEPEWQALIFGGSKFDFSTPPSTDLFFINSQYIAYSVTTSNAMNVQSLINPFRFVFFDKKITVEIDYDLNGLIIQTPGKKVIIGLDSPTLEKDYHIINNLIGVNHENMNEIIEKINEQTIKIKETKKTEAKKNLENVDSRFKTDGYIISNNYIPKGFVFKEPIVISGSKPLGLSNFTKPQSGYIKAYEYCLAFIKEEIDRGHIDAVFNLKYTTQSVQGSYEVVMFGDGVIVDEHKQD